MKRIGLFLVLLISALVGCAPADVSGVYATALTDGANGCGIANWTPGTTSNVQFTITQSGDAISGTIGEPTGTIIDIAVGGRTFTGNVAGSHVDMILHGTRAQNQNGCAYTWDVRIQGDLTGNALQGTVTWSANTNTAPACSTLSQCSSVQNFSGSRPPR